MLLSGIAFLSAPDVIAASKDVHNRYYDVEEEQMTALLFSSGDEEISLDSSYRVLSSDLDSFAYTCMQDIIFRDGTDRSIGSGDTAPGVFTATMSLTLFEVREGNILTFVAKSRTWNQSSSYWPSNISDWNSNAFGFSLTDEGWLLFSCYDRLTDVGGFMAEIAKLEEGITYNITLTSHARPLFLEHSSSSGDNMMIGRGEKNFTITISCANFSSTVTTAGFGLNGDEFAYLEVGCTNGPKGGISNLKIKTIPEPATAFLGALVLVSFSARRRRK